MLKLIKRYHILVLIVGALIGARIADYQIAQQVNNVEEGEATIIITTTDGLVAKTTVSFDEETTLLNAMEENFDVEIQDELFITSIEGYSQSAEDNLWWVYESNEEMVTVGADEYILIDEDVIEWELMAF